MTKLTDIITQPGKFEGEPIYVKQLWDFVLDGGEDEVIYDECESPSSVFYVDPAMRELYALEDDAYVIILWEDSQGFVNHSILTGPQYQQALVDIELARDTDTEDK